MFMRFAKRHLAEPELAEIRQALHGDRGDVFIALADGKEHTFDSERDVAMWLLNEARRVNRAGST